MAWLYVFERSSCLATTIARIFQVSGVQLCRGQKIRLISTGIKQVFREQKAASAHRLARKYRALCVSLPPPLPGLNSWQATFPWLYLHYVVVERHSFGGFVNLRPLLHQPLPRDAQNI